MGKDTRDFATTGTDAYAIPGQKENTSGVILTINQDIPPGGILIDKAKEFNTKNTIVEFFSKIDKLLISRSKVKLRDKAVFFHLLSVMINAGMPMVTSLKSLVSQTYKTPRLQMVIEEISKQVEAGSSLSEAMLKNNDVFEEQEVGMVQAGESSGQLSQVLDNISVDLDKAYSIRSKVKSAMMYPIIVMILLVGVVIAMMVFVVPQLKDLFNSNQIELPMVTKIVVAISNFMVTQKFVLAGSVIGAVVFLLIFRRTDIGKYMIDEFKIKVPVFGGLFRKAYLSRFARSLGNLLDSNVSIVRTIEISANSIGNDVYKRRLLLSAEDVKQGIPLAESLTESDLFPPILVNMVQVGEQTAELDDICKKLATFYESEVDVAVAGISKLIEPVVLVAIGLTVGTVVAAIMLPIMRLSSIADVL
ncbi:MAG: type II secretion system F family protein [Candidatus Curtissbacteria bacterium]|nr:type II secretion system F family protein [Candidatus Curtissbacteria bacterium]